MSIEAHRVERRMLLCRPNGSNTLNWNENNEKKEEKIRLLIIHMYTHKIYSVYLMLHTLKFFFGTGLSVGLLL